MVGIPVSRMVLTSKVEANRTPRLKLMGMGSPILSKKGGRHLLFIMFMLFMLILMLLRFLILILTLTIS